MRARPLACMLHHIQISYPLSPCLLPASGSCPLSPPPATQRQTVDKRWPPVTSDGWRPDVLQPAMTQHPLSRPLATRCPPNRHPSTTDDPAPSDHQRPNTLWPPATSRSALSEPATLPGTISSYYGATLTIWYIGYLLLQPYQHSSIWYRYMKVFP
jgi:hypothetical protein